MHPQQNTFPWLFDFIFSSTNGDKRFCIRTEAPFFTNRWSHVITEICMTLGTGGKRLSDNSTQK